MLLFIKMSNTEGKVTFLWTVESTKFGFGHAKFQMPLDTKVKISGYMSLETKANVRAEDGNLLIIITQGRLAEYLELNDCRKKSSSD